MYIRNENPFLQQDQTNTYNEGIQILKKNGLNYSFPASHREIRNAYLVNVVIAFVLVTLTARIILQSLSGFTSLPPIAVISTTMSAHAVLLALTLFINHYLWKHNKNFKKFAINSSVLSSLGANDFAKHTAYRKGWEVGFGNELRDYIELEEKPNSPE